MLVSIIILNYNTFKLTCDCVQSIITHTHEVPYEIVLVDNNSKECNPDDFLQRFPNIVLVKSPVNGGFAKGNNLGITHAKGDIILLLNSDTYLTEDAISKAATMLASLPKTGVLGVKMFYPAGGIQHTARRFRGIGWELLDLFRFIPMLMPYKKRAKLMLGKYFKSDFNTTCDWLNGAFFMFPKAVLSALPGNILDERFFMYGEDHLWCWQIKQAGYDCFFYSETSIVHINNGSTSKQKQLQLLKVMMHNELAIMRARNKGWLYYILFCLIYLGKEYSRYAVKWLAFTLLNKQIK